MTGRCHETVTGRNIAGKRRIQLKYQGRNDIRVPGSGVKRASFICHGQKRIQCPSSSSRRGVIGDSGIISAHHHDLGGEAADVSVGVGTVIPVMSQGQNVHMTQLGGQGSFGALIVIDISRQKSAFPICRYLNSQTEIIGIGFWGGLIVSAVMDDVDLHCPAQCETGGGGSVPGLGQGVEFSYTGRTSLRLPCIGGILFAVGIHLVCSGNIGGSHVVGNAFAAGIRLGSVDDSAVGFCSFFLPGICKDQRPWVFFRGFPGVISGGLGNPEAVIRSGLLKRLVLCAVWGGGFLCGIIPSSGSAGRRGFSQKSFPGIGPDSVFVRHQCKFLYIFPYIFAALSLQKYGQTFRAGRIRRALVIPYHRDIFRIGGYGMGADKIEGVFSGDCIPLRRLHRDSVGDLCFAVIVFLQVFETVQPISGGIRLYGLGSHRPCQRVGKLHGYLGGPDLVRVVPVLPGNASLDRNFFRIKRSGGIEILDQRGAHLLGCLDHVIINIEVIPQISAYIGILVFLDVDPFGMKGADDLIRGTDMVAVGMSSDIKFKVFCGDPYGPHIGNNPVFISLTDDNP